MIEAVVFDYGQTLVDSAEGFRSAEKDAEEKIFAELACSSHEAFLSDYREIRKSFHLRSIFSRPAIWKEVYRRFGRNPDEDLLLTWEADYWGTVQEKTRLFPEALTVLEGLSSTRRIAMITNTQGQRAEGNHRIRSFPGLGKLFEFIVVAGEGGIPAKPDPEPFRFCLKKLDLPPETTVYVGDDWRIDILGARGVGMHAVWLKHRLVRRSHPSPDMPEPAVPVITELSPLLDLERLLGQCSEKPVT
jgi:putative hydrolase of the HAD superfamily